MSGMQDWFYHAPAKRQEKEAINYPAASQIPGLSGVVVDEREDEFGTKRGYFKESDTKYVRLAKMGGRKDLLRFRSPKTLSDDPVPYPRPDWLDWDQEAGPDAGDRKVYLPEYMVYDEHHSDPDAEPYMPRRPPYSLNDQVSVFEREGGARKPIDKTVKLPEIKRPGRRHYSKKDNDRPAGSDKAGKKQITSNRPQVNESEPIMFGKLLGMGYQQDWMKEREKYYDQHHKIFENRAGLSNQPKEKTKSEYQDIFGKEEQKRGSGKTHRHPAARTTTEKKEYEAVAIEDEALFKLSKFNKVPAKVDCNRPKRDSAHRTAVEFQSQPQAMEA
ncbi:uncharacterized protein C7orf57-like isoform X2 [Glandiceps talaboti]